MGFTFALMSDKDIFEKQDYIGCARRDGIARYVLEGFPYISAECWNQIAEYARAEVADVVYEFADADTISINGGTRTGALCF